MHPLEIYLTELRDIRSSGAAVKETSYYPALANLLNRIGKTLKPRVHCVINLQNRGAGLPDGGLFTAEQLRRGDLTKLMAGQMPARGAIEVKGPAEDVHVIGAGEQVARYLGTYRQVLVTNYRAFTLVGYDAAGVARELESFSLAESESALWSMSRNPEEAVGAHGDLLVDYLKRVMLRPAPLAAPADVAWFLASYAREAKMRIAHAEMPALDAVRSALEEALGLRFEGARGDHFFRSTLVQTLFYGVFSAWVLWSKRYAPTDMSARFDWRTAAWELHVPAIRALFEQVTLPGRLVPLGLVEALDWTGDALNRVDRASFFEAFRQEEAVQYFYEPFLEAFDPELRKELGVWYTPREIVQYMVARVDTVLREELKIEDGLANPRVYVLDPCCGTGAYLVEVLKRIDATLKTKSDDALGGHDIKKAAKERIFGFEILPAPFVVSHLQLGLLLHNLGAALSDEKDERVGVYLTNALTGWEPPKEPKHHLDLPDLEDERTAADEVKREKPILVILGNPPYNAFAGVSPKEEQGLVEPYKAGLISEWGIKKFNLDELYVRFLRLAERRITEMTGEGIVSFISSYSYLSDPSFVVVRRRLLGEFQDIWIDCMNGDSRETGKRTPDGSPDPSVFSTEHNREGIRLGTAVCVMVRKGTSNSGDSEAVVRFRQFWGAKKRSELLESLYVADFDGQYLTSKPSKYNRYTLRPTEIGMQYLSWPTMVQLAARRPFAGLSEDRRKSLIGIDRGAIEARMRRYFDPKVSWNELVQLGTGLTTNVPRFDAKKARALVIQSEKYDDSRLLRFAMRPFDIQWCYYSPIRPLWREPRPDYWSAYTVGSPAIVSRFKAARFPEGSPIVFTRQFCDYHMMPPNASVFPFNHSGAGVGGTGGGQTSFLHSDEPAQANLSGDAHQYLLGLGIPAVGDDGSYSSLIWFHVLAVGYSTAYLTENADGIRQDWPRIPMPSSRGLLETSAELGRQVAELLDTECDVPGVTSGTIRPELRSIAVISRVGGGALDPDSSDLDVTAGWGHAAKDGITMPGKGKVVVRDYTTEELSLLESSTAEPSVVNRRVGCLGETTRDVYLNEVAYWRNVPERVWTYTIGGYQVMKKWLSYREKPLLGRSLRPEEAREVTNMARRIAAILLLEPELDANYAAVKAATYAWPR